MPSIDRVGCPAVPRCSTRMLTVDSFTTMNAMTSAARGGEGTPPRATRVVCLLLHQLGLHGGRQLRREVDVTRQVGLAFHRMWLAGKRVFEHKRREVRSRRLLAAGCERDG